MAVAVELAVGEVVALDVLVGAGEAVWVGDGVALGVADDVTVAEGV